MANRDPFRNRAAACEAHDDIPRSPAEGETIGEVILRRYSRRAVMRGTLGVTAAAALFGPAALATGEARAGTASDRFDFAEVEAGIDKTHHVAPGYRAEMLLRWGDALVPDMPDFDPKSQSAADQSKRFGYNNDYIAYFPIDGSSRHGLLAVNHEYTNEELMFPGVKKRQDTSDFEEMTAALVDIEMAAYGVTIVEIERDGEDWRVRGDGKLNRRITSNTHRARAVLPRGRGGHRQQGRPYRHLLRRRRPRRVHLSLCLQGPLQPRRQGRCQTARCRWRGSMRMAVRTGCRSSMGAPVSTRTPALRVKPMW
jgi:hypothetical protein